MIRPTRPTTFHKRNRVFGFAISILIALAMQGCAFLESSGSGSDSSGSVSDSIGSFSDSSTSSSGDETAYREDIRTFTVAHLRAGGSSDGLRLGLSEVALVRGISDWEALPGSFVAIGFGLAQAGVSAEEFSAYRDALTRPGSENQHAIIRAFASAMR